MSGPEAFRPQGRLPLDPFTTPSNLSSIRTRARIEEEGKRKPNWKIKSEDIEALWTKIKDEKIILVVGAPTATDLGPLLSSQLFSKSLVILATERPPSNLASLVQKSGPALVVLRLQPLTRPIPQHLHSVLTRAEVVVQRWRWDGKSLFSNPANDRGRSRRKQAETLEEVRAVQFSELGGVFGRDFVVAEDVGYIPNTASSSQLKSDSAIPRSVPKSNKKNRDQRSFDVLINFVPSSVIDEGDEALLNSVSFVSATSRSFLSGIGVTSDRRGRSMSRGSRGRSSSLTRIKDWVSRSRSRSRIRDISITRLNGASKPTWNFSTVVGSGGKKRVPKSPAVVSIRNNAAKGEMSATAEDDCDDAGDSSAIRNQTYVQRKRERATSLVSENIQRTRALMQIRSTVNQVPKESRNKRAEKKVLSSWSRSQLDQANRTNEDDDVFIRGKGTPSPRKPTHPSTEEPRAYIIHVLPLSPPAVLHASFGPSRHTTIVSHASGSGSGSGLSSAETDIPLLGASHNISGKDIKQNDIVHSVPDALKPESILSSKVTALNKHMRGASLDSTNQPVFSPTNSLLSLSALHSSLSRNEIKEQPSVEGKIRKEASDSSHSTEGTQSLLSSHDHVSSEVRRDTISTTPTFRQTSVLSPAVEAAVETATRYSVHAQARSMSPATMIDMRRRQSVAMEVASAAAMAAMEVHLAKANEAKGTLEPSKIPDSGQALEGEGEKKTIGGSAFSRQSSADGDLPVVLMPHPHRQSTLILRSSTFLPLDVHDIIQSGSPMPAQAPMSLLPRPHARSRALSLDTGTRVSVDLGIPTVKSSLAPSISVLPSSDPECYYERTQTIQKLEKILLSHSYVDSSELSSNASVSALPKGAALPAFPTLINIRASPKAPQKDNSSLQKAPAAVSYLLPQGLLDLTFKMSLHSVPDISLVDLILHGLLDPIPESLALYRNAVMQANQMNPPADQADPEARAGVTLNGLMALGTLSGEESGEHGIPRAWIGGVADIDIEGAKPETLRISSDPVTDPASRDDLLPKTSGPAPISTTDHLILSMKLPGASISAVSLHSQTVARSPIARSPIASASPEAAEFTGTHPSSNLVVIGVENDDDGWKRFVKDFVDEDEEVNVPEGARQPPLHSASIPPIILSLEAANSIPQLTRTVTAPELGTSFNQTLSPYSFIPPGAALPKNPHSPNIYSSFPRHSVMNFTPNFAALSRRYGDSEGSSAESDVSSTSEHTVGDSIGADNDKESEVTCDKAATGSILSMPSPYSYASSTSIADTEVIFGGDTDLLPEDGPSVAINTVSVFSDSTSVVVRGSLLFDRERTSTSSELDLEPQIHISETELVSGGWKEEPLRSSTRSTLSASSSASSVSEGDKKDLKVWLQRSPKSIERALLSFPTSPSEGDFYCGVGAIESRRNSVVSLEGDSSTPTDPPTVKEEFIHDTGIRRRSTLPNERLDNEGTETSPNSKRLSRAGSWTATNLDPEPPKEEESFSNAPSSPARNLSSSPLLQHLSENKTERSSMSDDDFGSIQGQESLHSGTSTPVLVVPPTSSPHLSILSLPLNNLLNQAESTPALVSFGSSTPSPPPRPLATSFTSSPSLSLVDRRLLSATGQSNLARRHSNGGAVAPPVGPRAPLSRAGSVRTISSSLDSPPETPKSTRPRPLPRPTLDPRLTDMKPVPVETVSLEEEEEEQEQEQEEQVKQAAEKPNVMKSLPPSPEPSSISRPIVTARSSSSSLNRTMDVPKQSHSEKATHSRSSSPNAFRPLRKLAIDEATSPKAGTRRGPSNRAIIGAGIRPLTAFGDSNDPTKPKWKFWSSGNAERPLSMAVDLTRD